MQNPSATNAPPLYKPSLFLPLEQSPLKKKIGDLYCPVTGYVYCLQTGSLYQKTFPSVPMASNVQQSTETLDKHVEDPPISQPQIKINAETGKATSSQSRKKKKTQNKVHEPVKCDKPLLQNPPQEASASGKNKKKQKARTKQSDLKKANDPSETHKKPPDTKKKPDPNTPIKTKGNNDQKQKKKRKRKKKAQQPKPASTSNTSNTPKISDTSKTNKRYVPRKIKHVPLWSYIAPFNRRPYAQKLKWHRTKNSVWTRRCKDCVLASSVHDIVHSPFTKSRDKLMPRSQLQVMLTSGIRKLIPDQEWMKRMEEEAIYKYKKMKSDSKYKVHVTDYCKVSHSEKPWLAGLCMWVMDRHTEEKWPMVVKCLYKHPDSSLRDASKYRSFCLTWNEVDYELRSDHTCYTQMQCLLAITDKIYAELVVHTRKETTIVPVYFDADFWEETELRLETFYTYNLLPYFEDDGMAHKFSKTSISENSEE